MGEQRMGVHIWSHPDMAHRRNLRSIGLRYNEKPDTMKMGIAVEHVFKI